MNSELQQRIISQPILDDEPYQVLNHTISNSAFQPVAPNSRWRTSQAYHNPTDMYFFKYNKHDTLIYSYIDL